MIRAMMVGSTTTMVLWQLLIQARNSGSSNCVKPILGARSEVWYSGSRVGGKSSSARWCRVYSVVVVVAMLLNRLTEWLKQSVSPIPNAMCRVFQRSCWLITNHVSCFRDSLLTDTRGDRRSENKETRDRLSFCSNNNHFTFSPASSRALVTQHDKCHRMSCNIS